MDSSNVNNVPPVRQDRRGTNNPFFGHRHTPQSKKKMSQAAIRRNQEYKKALNNQHHVSMEEFLSNNPTVEEYIKTLVRESIERLIWKDKHQ